MGMTATFVQVSPDLLERILADPSLMLKIYEEETESEEFEGETFAMVDIDKSWQGIHFLLTGDPEGGALPLANAILGGAPLDNSEEYEETRFLSPEEVTEVTEALTDVTAEHLERRYDPELMDQLDIYPGYWMRDREESLEYLISYYNDLKQFYESAAREGKAMIISIG